jgi:4-hydroxyphenylacetate 3-monooxygenase
MPIRTGEQFLEAIRDDRRIFIDGERVADVTRDRRLAGAARSVAELYGMQHDPALAARMTFASPSSGAPVGLSFIEPRTIDDLIRRRDMVKIWMDATCGMFGRSPDFLNVMLTGLAAAAPAFGERDQKFADNIRAYHLLARERDLCMTHTLLNPQVDRSRPVEQQEKDLAAKIVRETDAGIVVKGARMVSTLCAYADEILVMPSTFLATNEEAAPYAFGFAIPVATPGLRFVCRPSVVHQNAASPMDFPLSSRLDEGDGLAVFDDVLVPWERVFIHRDPQMCNGLFQRTQAMAQVMHQTSTKNLAKAEFMMALGFAIACSTNIDAHLHVQGMLAELIQHAEFVRACIRASEADAAPSPASGLMTPAEMPLWTVRMMFPKMFIRACEIIQILGAGGLVAVPSYAELSGPAAADVETYAQAANADAPTRVKLFRLAFDAAVSSFSGRQQLYERYYSGDPVRLAGALYALYDKDAPVDRIHRMLDELEAKS